MEKLFILLQPALESKVFLKILDWVMWMNPIAILPQVILAFTASNVEAISAPMYAMFALIQTAFLLQGVRLKSGPMALAMFVSLIESLTIIVVVLVR